MTIYNPDGTTLATLAVQDGSRRTASLMGDDALTLTVLAPQRIAFPPRCYAVAYGMRYTLYNTSEATKRGSRSHEYTLTLHTAAHELSLVLMRNPEDHRLRWPLVETPRAHLQAICDNLNATPSHYRWRVDYAATLGMAKAAEGSQGAYTDYHPDTFNPSADPDEAPSGTTLDTYNDNGDEKLLEYDAVYCIDALQSLAEEYETEYSVRYVTMNGNDYALLSLNHVELYRDAPLELSYGKGGGLLPGCRRSPSTATPRPNVIYIDGGDRNIPLHYGQTATESNGTTTYSGVASKTLLLPKNRLCVVVGNSFYFSNGEIPSSRIGIMPDGTVKVTAIPLPSGSGTTSGATVGSPSTPHNYENMVDEDGVAAGYTDPVTGDMNVDPFFHDPSFIGVYTLPCYLTDADGLSVRRVRHTAFDPAYTAPPEVQGYQDCTDIYPSRIGTVLTGAVTNEAGTVLYQSIDTGTATANAAYGSTDTLPQDQNMHFYDIFDEELAAENWTYTDHAVAGQTMTVVFQDGMLAGREFSIQGYDGGSDSGKPICVKKNLGTAQNPIWAMRIPLCQAEIDSVVMPGGRFSPAPGDHYAVFHCDLPAAYIGGIAYGAEFRALKAIVGELVHTELQGCAMTVDIDPVWHRANAASADIKLAVGAYVKVTDSDLFGDSNNVMTFRITSVERNVNNPHNVKVTLGDTILPKFRWQKQLPRAIKQVVRVTNRYQPYVPHIDANGGNADSSIADDTGGVGQPDRPRGRYLRSITPVTTLTIPL